MTNIVYVPRVNIIELREGLSLSEVINGFTSLNFKRLGILIVDLEVVMDELENLGMTDGLLTDENNFLILQRIGASIFNTSYIKDRAPISSPEFMSHLGAYISEGELVSWIVICYHYSIPIFINNALDLNPLFAGGFKHTTELVSADKDYGIMSRLNHADYKYYRLGEPEQATVFGDIMPLCNPLVSYEFINEGFKIPKEEEGKIPYLYEELIE